jgi:23S rRNA (guanine745-N1)-methyltransferase
MAAAPDLETAAARRVVLLCPVRGCREPLLAAGDPARTWRCARGHSFDRARSGYLNLLQPQDRRSRQPGDSAQTALARRRLYEAGHLAPLVEELRRAIAHLALPARQRWLDVGCGEGALYAALVDGVEATAVEAHGVDLSAAAVDLAARRAPGVLWLVANADRELPYAPASFDLVLSITARLQPEEFRRLLDRDGALLLAVPGADDLGELRAAVQGRAVERHRLGPALERCAGSFIVERRSTLSWQADLDRDGLADLLASGYRGARRGERARLGALERLRVTLSRDLAVLRPRPAALSNPPGPVRPDGESVANRKETRR